MAGRVIALDEVPDPVFAQAMVGPGVAVEPNLDTGTGTSEPQRACAPISGTLVKLHPHAFVVSSDHGPAVLVHLGIDTVELRGEGFTALASEDDRVEAGEPIIEWDPRAVDASGRSAVVPVISLDTSEAAISLAANYGSYVQPGSPLYEVGSGRPAAASA